MNIDTSMVTTEWIMFELAKNLVVQECLYKEIFDVTSGQDLITTRMVKEEDIPNMPYLSVVIKETFRKDTTLGGYDIPKGWQVGDTLIY